MNLRDSIYMNGYGFYVWGSYLVALIAMGAEVLVLLRRRRALKDRSDLPK